MIQTAITTAFAMQVAFMFCGALSFVMMVVGSLIYTTETGAVGMTNPAKWISGEPDADPQRALFLGAIGFSYLIASKLIAIAIAVALYGHDFYVLVGHSAPGLLFGIVTVMVYGSYLSFSGHNIVAMARQYRKTVIAIAASTVVLIGVTYPIASSAIHFDPRLAAYLTNDKAPL